MMEYLFKYWDKLKSGFVNRYLAIFLDYDGTLCPIAESPQKAVISQETKELLVKLSKSQKCKIAIISGRTLEDIKNRVGLRDIIYVGNHGLELEGPKIKFRALVPLGYKSVLAQINKDLAQKVSMIKGAFLEHKVLSLSLHYRLVDKKYATQIRTIFHETVAPYIAKDKIKIKRGKKIFEIRPPVEWDKGKVVLWLLARQQFVLGSNKIYPIYIGDDVTDEDAFKVLKNKGLAIFVGRPRPSYARYYLKDTGEVTQFLKKIL